MNKKIKQSAVDHSSKLLERIGLAVSSSISESWSNAKEEMKDEVYCALQGYTEANVMVVDGCSGEDWFNKPLSELVTEFIKDNKTDRDDEVEDAANWADMVALDFENQAKRLRDHAANMRQSLEAEAT